MAQRSDVQADVGGFGYLGEREDGPAIPGPSAVIQSATSPIGVLVAGLSEPDHPRRCRPCWGR
jgi:hypothetical protein